MQVRRALKGARSGPGNPPRSDWCSPPWDTRIPPNVRGGTAHIASVHSIITPPSIRVCACVCVVLGVRVGVRVSRV